MILTRKFISFFLSTELRLDKWWFSVCMNNVSVQWSGFLFVGEWRVPKSALFKGYFRNLRFKDFYCRFSFEWRFWINHLWGASLRTVRNSHSLTRTESRPLFTILWICPLFVVVSLIVCLFLFVCLFIGDLHNTKWGIFSHITKNLL